MSSITRQPSRRLCLTRLQCSFSIQFSSSTAIKPQYPFGWRQFPFSTISRRRHTPSWNQCLRSLSNSRKGLTQGWKKDAHNGKKFNSAITTSLFTISGDREDELIPSLDKLKDISIPLERHAFVTVLLTPSLSSVVQPDNKTLRRILASAFHSVQQGAFIDVVTAVVDELPLPRSIDSDYLSTSKTGLSGISVAIETSSSTRSPDERRDSYIASSELPGGSITFSINNGRENLSLNTIQYSHSITLPLPNTIFETGRETSINEFRLSVESTGEDSRISDVAISDVKSLWQVDLDMSRFARDLQGHVSVQNQHTRPLTPFRKVTGSMGNILSEFQGDLCDERPLPASYELEQALRKEANLSFEVWAEVIPYEKWTAEPHLVSELEGALGKGHHFHRVQSGGGGWGTRAGLLSLEPPPAFLSIDSTRDDATQLGAVSLFTDVVRHNDIVRFLRIDTSRGQDAESDPSVSPHQAPVGRGGVPRAFAFGTSSLKRSDDMPSLSSNQSNGGVLIPGVFGALSHRPAALIIESFNASGRAMVGELPLGLVTKSVLPPASRVLWS